MAVIKIVILADSTQAANHFKKIETAFDKIKSTVWGLSKAFIPLAGATAIFAKLSSSMSSVIPETQKLASEVYQLQRTTGLSAEAASELIAVADQVGVSFDAIQSAVTQVSRKIGGLKDMQDLVIDTSGKATDVFKEFGIQVKNTDGTLKSFTDVFGQIREKIQSTSTETERMAIATQFFKGNAVELLPILTMSQSRWKEIAEDARKYGIILTEDNVQAVRQYIIVHRDLDDAVMGFKLTIGTALIPILKDFTEELTLAIKNIRDFTKENQAFLSLPFETLKYVKDNFTMLTAAISAMAIVAYSEAIAALITRLIAFNLVLALTVTHVRALGAALGTLFVYEAYEWGKDWIYGMSKEPRSRATGH